MSPAATSTPRGRQKPTVVIVIVDQYTPSTAPSPITKKEMKRPRAYTIAGPASAAPNLKRQFAAAAQVVEREVVVLPHRVVPRRRRDRPEQQLLHVHQRVDERRQRGEHEDDAHQAVHHGEELALGRLRAEVAVADGRDRHRQEVRRVEQPPPLELVVHQTAHGIVAAQDDARACAATGSCPTARASRAAPPPTRRRARAPPRAGGGGATRAFRAQLWLG